MKVEITPSKATHEDYPYGDGTAREHLCAPAEALFAFTDWAEVCEYLRDWAAGEKFHDMFDVTADDENETRHVEPENITFILRDKPVVAPPATTEPGRESSAHAETFLRGVIFCCAMLAVGCAAAFIIFKLYV